MEIKVNDDGSLTIIFDDWYLYYLFNIQLQKPKS